MVAASHLRSLQAIELALRLGSLKDAADALGITPAAVGQRIKMLEDYLGVDLLARGRSGLGPTEALVQALPHIERAFAELALAAEALDFQRPNEIQLAAPTDFVDLWLAPRLGAFRVQHPNILFCINGEGDTRLRLGQTDVEVSFADEAATGDPTRLALFCDYLAPIASPENATRISRGDPKYRLEGFPLLHLDFYRGDPASVDWPEWIAAHGHRKSPPGFGMRFQRISPGLEAVLSDAGLMIAGLGLLLGRLKAGEIVLPFPVKAGTWTRQIFQARFRKDALVRPQVRRFRDWLEAEALKTSAELAELVSGPARPARRKQ